MKLKPTLERVYKSLFSSSQAERRGILYLIPILLLIGIIALSLSRPRFEQALSEMADPGQPAQTRTAPDPQTQTRPGTGTQTPQARPGRQLPAPFAFDPNTADLETFTRLGFTPKQAQAIINYREKGKIFRTPADFATCYTVSPEMFARLEPHIQIAATTHAPNPKTDPKSTPEPRQTPAADTIPLHPFDPNRLTAAEFAALGIVRTEAQGRTIVNFRNTLGGFKTPDDFLKSYPVQPRAEELRPYVKISPPPPKPKIDLNTADSAALTTVSGIGPVYAARIVAYRNRLGGFASREQLAEIEGMTEANYRRIIKEISVDIAVIQKIDINFVAPKALGAHPYVTPEMLRKIVKNRQKGGWSTTQQMIDDHTITDGQAEKLAPYLTFNE